MWPLVLSHAMPMIEYFLVSLKSFIFGLCLDFELSTNLYFRYACRDSDSASFINSFGSDLVHYDDRWRNGPRVHCLQEGNNA